MKQKKFPVRSTNGLVIWRFLLLLLVSIFINRPFCQVEDDFSVYTESSGLFERNESSANIPVLSTLADDLFLRSSPLPSINFFPNEINEPLHLKFRTLRNPLLNLDRTSSPSNVNDTDDNLYSQIESKSQQWEASGKAGRLRWRLAELLNQNKMSFSMNRLEVASLDQKSALGQAGFTWDLLDTSNHSSATLACLGFEFSPGAEGSLRWAIQMGNRTLGNMALSYRRKNYSSQAKLFVSEENGKLHRLVGNMDKESQTMGLNWERKYPWMNIILGLNWENVNPQSFTEEYAIADSGQALSLSAGFIRSLAAHKFTSGVFYREEQRYSIGRRIPLGSESLKRWHYASWHSLNWEWNGTYQYQIPDGRQKWDFNIHWRHRDLESKPVDGALEQRRESLSYNRLGWSWLADVYANLWKSSEFASLEGEFNQWALSPCYSRTYRNVAFEISLPSGISNINGQWQRYSADQIIIFRDPIQFKQYDMNITAIQLAPSLSASMQLGDWTFHGGVQQALVFPIQLYSGAHRSDDNPSETKKNIWGDSSPVLGSSGLLIRFGVDFKL